MNLYPRSITGRLHQVAQTANELQPSGTSTSSRDSWTKKSFYHDLFSESVEEWNDSYKARQRKQRATAVMAVALACGLALFVAYDVVRNATEQHIRLTLKHDVSDKVELYSGSTGSWDVFHLQSFEAGTALQRWQIELEPCTTSRP